MSSPLIQPPTQTRSLWDTLTMHASNLYTKGKALANTATDRIRGQVSSVASPSVATPSVATPSVGTPSVMTPRQQMAITSGGKKSRKTQRTKKSAQSAKKGGKSAKKAKSAKKGGKSAKKGGQSAKKAKGAKN